jgi:chloride channel protein, CIC family
MNRPTLSRPTFGARAVELRELAKRSKEVLLLAAVVGALTGLGVAGFDEAVTRGLDALDRAPLWLVAVSPFVGLSVAALALRWLGRGSSPSTADEYLHSFHDPSHRLRLQPLIARMIAGIATLASGAPMGLEGPSLYLGASLGDMLQRRFPRLFSAQNRRALLVAGAGAGVAAIFKAPATGAVFALEVPYHEDFARRMLAPTLVASATSYLAFVAVHGTTPLLAVKGSPPFSFKDLAASLVLGLLAGIGARSFAWMLRRAKRISTVWSPMVRVPIVGAVLAVIFVLARVAGGQNLTTGPGYDTIRWALDPTHSLWLVALILVLRATATSATVAGGGVGGLFIPLVVAGALTGRVVGGSVHALDTSLFTVVGVAAFLGAGYRVPLAAITFVAEATGRPGFVVPGLLAAVVAGLVMGRSSVTAYQQEQPLVATGPPPRPNGAHAHTEATPGHLAQPSATPAAGPDGAR